MSDPTPRSELDEAAGHRHFSASCFNRTWELIDQPNRTPADNEQMLLRAYASFWHWTQRPDVMPRHLSVGYWLLSRVHALRGESQPARHYGELARTHAAAESPFYLGYAHEALARAAKISGDSEELQLQLSLAEACLAGIEVQDDRSLLESDLLSLRQP